MGYGDPQRGTGLPQRGVKPPGGGQRSRGRGEHQHSSTRTPGLHMHREHGQSWRGAAARGRRHAPLHTPAATPGGGSGGGGGSYFKLKKGNRLVKLTDGSGSASRKGAPLVFAVLCLRGCATVPWQPSLLRCRRLASSTASTLQGFPSGNESLRAWLRALRVPLSSPRCQEVIVQRFLIVSYPRGGSRAEQSTEQLRPPRPAARRSRWLVGSSRLGRNTR